MSVGEIIRESKYYLETLGFEVGNISNSMTHRNWKINIIVVNNGTMPFFIILNYENKCISGYDEFRVENLKRTLRRFVIKTLIDDDN